GGAAPVVRRPVVPVHRGGRRLLPAAAAPAGAAGRLVSGDASPRDRVLAAVVAVAGRTGLAQLTVEEVAREAGVGRASVYRWFPGGREQLVDEAVTWEIGRYLAEVEAEAEGAADL